MPAEKKVLVLVADGSEEIEVVVTVDVLRRAGIQTTLASVSGSGSVTCSRQVVITPDASLEAIKGDLDGYEVLVLPGGAAGAATFVGSELVQSVIKQFASNSRLIAAICAGKNFAGGGREVGRIGRINPVLSSLNPTLIMAWI